MPSNLTADIILIGTLFTGGIFKPDKWDHRQSISNECASGHKIFS